MDGARLELWRRLRPADEKNVTMNIYNLMQGGLTLGAKDYYLNNDANPSYP